MYSLPLLSLFRPTNLLSKGGDDYVRFSRLYAYDEVNLANINCFLFFPFSILFFFFLRSSRLITLSITTEERHSIVLTAAHHDY